MFIVVLKYSWHLKTEIILLLGHQKQPWVIQVSSHGHGYVLHPPGRPRLTLKNKISHLMATFNSIYHIWLQMIQWFIRCKKCVQGSSKPLLCWFITEIMQEMVIGWQNLMICNILDSDMRMVADENLNRVIRSLGENNVARIQVRMDRYLLSFTIKWPNQLM